MARMRGIATYAPVLESLDDLLADLDVIVRYASSILRYMFDDEWDLV